jgi:hypothetical protein
VTEALGYVFELGNEHFKIGHDDRVFESCACQSDPNRDRVESLARAHDLAIELNDELIAFGVEDGVASDD